MTNTAILLDPTGEQQSAQRQRRPRPDSLEGLTIGLLDIAKARGNIFIDQLENRLAARGLTVRRYRKPTFARVAPVELKQTITTECDVLIEALAD